MTQNFSKIAFAEPFNIPRYDVRNDRVPLRCKRLCERRLFFFRPLSSVFCRWSLPAGRRQPALLGHNVISQVELGDIAQRFIFANGWFTGPIWYNVPRSQNIILLSHFSSNRVVSLSILTLTWTRFKLIEMESLMVFAGEKMRACPPCRPSQESIKLIIHSVPLRPLSRAT